MAWKNGISGCFGIEDKKFALHSSDRANAQKVLSEALSSGAGFAEYKAAFREWLENEGCNPEHVKKEMVRVSSLESYFTKD